MLYHLLYAAYVGEALTVTPTAELRAKLSSALRNGDARWLHLTGLSLDDTAAHRGFWQTLAALGVGGEVPRLKPSVVVLDWSTAQSCSAEGLAFFSVLCRHLVRTGVHVVVCEPAYSDIADALDLSGLRDTCGVQTWIRQEKSNRAKVRCLTRAAVFGAGSSDAPSVFCSDLSSALKRTSLSKEARQAIIGATLESVQNTLSHAGAEECAAVAVLFPRLRPKVLQIGLADSGRGISGSLRNHPRHQWLRHFDELSLTEAVVRQSLTRRAETESAVNEDGNGGMGQVVRRFLTLPRSEFLLRSGEALLALRGIEPEMLLARNLGYGSGTQLRLEARLA